MLDSQCVAVYNATTMETAMTFVAISYVTVAFCNLMIVDATDPDQFASQGMRRLFMNSLGWPVVLAQDLMAILRDQESC
jgi:hypothetical protein